MKRLIRVAAVMGAACMLGTVLTACSGGQATGGSRSSPAAETLCGVVLSGPAKNALHDLTGTNKPKTAGDGVRATAKVLATGIPSEGESRELCTAYASTFNSGTSFTYALEKKLPQGGIDPEFAQYSMGALTLAKAKSAYLFMECKSPRFELPTSEPVLLSGEIYNGRLPEGKNDGARDENLRLLHAVSLALVRELHCKNDAGLPATFRMPPKATKSKT